MDEDCCATYKHNLHGECYATYITTKTDFPKADIIIGGPPCQPFSVRGKQKGVQDARNGFPAFVKAVKVLKPKIFVIENVRGILYKNKPYLEKILSQLKRLGYKIECDVFNVVDYAVPQNRQRIVIVGHTGGFSFPPKLETRITAGEALGELAFVVPADAKLHVGIVASRQNLAAADAHLENGRAAGNGGRDGHERHDFLLAAAGQPRQKATDGLYAVLRIAGDADDRLVDPADLWRAIRRHLCNCITHQT